MKCKECEEIMSVDVDNHRYICDCGYIIDWSEDKRNVI